MKPALRALTKYPGYSAVIILTLALGIGANTAIFSFFHGILLRPLPVADADRVVLVKKDPRDFSDPMETSPGILAADFQELQSELTSLRDFATYTLDSATLTGTGTPALVAAAVVTDNFFSALGTHAAFGRTFTADATDVRAGRLATLSHRHWQSHFGGNPSVIGRTIRLNQVPVTIVGVMPPDFEFPREANYWVSSAGQIPESQLGLASFSYGGRGHYIRTILARLHPGVSREQAEREFLAAFNRLPNPNQANRTACLMTLRDQVVGDVRPVLSLLLVCVGLVLLISCFNVANLMLSRAVTRRQELGIRAALGASRWHIARQLLGESLLLSFLGGAIGVLLAAWGLGLLVTLAPASIPRLETIHLDANVLGFALGLTLLTGLACGLSPLIGLGRRDLASTTRGAGKGDTASPAPRRIRLALVAGEVAVSLVLLVAAGLLLRSVSELQAFSWGFDPSRVVSARVVFGGERYADGESQRRFYRSLLDRLDRTPGFESVGTKFFRVGDSWVKEPFVIEGQTRPADFSPPMATTHQVSEDYFRTMGIPLLAGRGFTSDDNENSPPVMIIDETFAQRFFPDGAVGRRVRAGGSPDEEGGWVEIVGVVSAVPSEGPSGPVLPELFRPFLQAPWNNFYVHARTSLDLATAGRLIQEAVASVDPTVPISDLAGMQQIVSRPAAARQFPLGLLGAFALLALLLAAVGIYAVTHHSVAQRTREIGVRMALGASPGSVVALMLHQSFRPILLGLAVGLIGATATAFAMRQLLFGVAPLDLPTFLIVPAVLAIIAALSCWLPARRATRVNPIEALRAD